MAHSEPKLKSYGDKETFCFRLLGAGNEKTVTTSTNLVNIISFAGTLSGFSNYYIYWVPCHYSMARPWVVDGETATSHEG
jgi:hypothetical protein